MKFSSDMAIETGDLEVFESGSVITFRELPLIMKLGTLEVTITFIPGAPNEPDAKVEFDEKGPTTIGIKFVNFRGNLMGSKEPIRMGTYNGRELYMNYLVTTVNTFNPESGRLFHYTWYLRKRGN